MKRKIDASKLDVLMRAAGFTVTALAQETGYSKEAVSNWCRGESQPRPAAVLKLALALGTTAEQLLAGPVPSLPQVSFRENAHRKLGDAFRQEFARSARHLECLAPYLPERMCRADVIHSPGLNYESIQAEALQFRARLGVAAGEYELDLLRLVAYIQASGAVLIPVPWGNNSHPINGAHVRLADSRTDWLYLNIDTPIIDAKFWLLHEIAHMLTPALSADPGTAEDYADAFAQAVLWPEPAARTLHARMICFASDALRIAHLKKLGAMLAISPYTLYLAANAYAGARGQAKLHLEPAIFGAVTNVVKQTPTLSELLFPTTPPEPADYVERGSKVFGPTFFVALRRFLQETGKSSGTLSRLLGLSTVDAMDIYGVLTRHGAAQATA